MHDMIKYSYDDFMGSLYYTERGSPYLPYPYPITPSPKPLQLHWRSGSGITGNTGGDRIGALAPTYDTTVAHRLSPVVS